jgi:hypothetical protein
MNGRYRYYLLTRQVLWFRQATDMQLALLPDSQIAARRALILRLLAWFRVVWVEIETCPTAPWEEATDEPIDNV